ncbi:MAG: sulfite exporter TauE/SafE family protein [Leptolyngbya sp. UWPOB_LEPTO1]|uniref:sulfite exporter TauE/SafE family protein n=1 Tax=Leptolyngbya sp. UWPOB_LEPTO1 TaxID=2815653 RepID=UPI001ACAC7EA|nr:sulfite exporter TauE/SafE family protein [Leptolyngbya sp. UWPOB_LEPTO1]MBN8560167.1 sulfite exporter TauE/SafE family protein [Leptolyngbya sp. UWPOB_LEPTO1]
MTTWIIGHLMAACIGLSLGLIGGGGSVLALPILVYVMGIPPKPAIAMTLVIVGAVSLLGVIPHWRAGNVRLKIALLFGGATMIGAFAGAKIATLPFVSGAFQMILFAVMILLAAGLMIRRSSKRPRQIELKSYPNPVCKYCWFLLLTEGIGVGVLTGLVGIGGGFAIVPTLVLLGRVPMKQAIGSSLLIIALNSVAGFLGYLGQVPLNWELTGSFILAASAGTIPGAYLAQFIPAQRLQQTFGYFLLAVAAFIFVQNRHSFEVVHSFKNTASQMIQYHTKY